MEEKTGAEKPSTQVKNTVITIRLRKPAVAAIWAWLIPGAGHWYQGRRAKSVIFAVCVLSTYFFGLAIGGGHVVYASLAKNDWRWQYFCQLGVGTPALPALVQTYRVRSGKEALFNDLMAPPGDVQPRQRDKLALWHEQYTSRFEIGTLYTMVAGLMNILAVFDAYGGPFVYPSERPERTTPTAESPPAAASSKKKRPSKKNKRK